MVTRVQTLAPEAPLRSTALPGGLMALAAGGGLCLLPGVPSLSACRQLLAACRRLGMSDAVAWVEVSGAGLLPLPYLPRPEGMPLEQWLPGAAAGELLTVLAGVVTALDSLAAAGYLPEPPSLDGAWVHGGQVTWLPAALLWAHQRRPGARCLAAAGWSAGVFLQRLLETAPRSAGLQMVWEELWLACHQLLEHGYGLNPAALLGALEQLGWRFNPDAPEPPAAAALKVLVDAGSIQRYLGYRTLDLVSLLRQIVGGRQPYEGFVFGPGTLPAPWLSQAHSARLEWLRGSLSAGMAQELQSSSVLLLCGEAAHVAPLLAALGPRAGKVVQLAPFTGSLALPAPWQSEVLPGGLAPWCRIGQGQAYWSEVVGG